ncbi:pyridoxal-phosphate dependent enzyme [Pseudodonghicola flavimaris]|uniref:Pyridoxal-phosphate dependent enzyme n=1 Tax=Pseudodonghicola flavimaris TaxID=3050036 RepID=A0ABT7F127_9RHOB|nr:pyridoxal-phosphate dependent enzyme [Pseudodonghicola flavimaris]MDK3018307.1 pyridoxal-phosphate dependent enzyme [Pseudodonghicola flavimaris]
MNLLPNPFRGRADALTTLADIPMPSVDSTRPLTLVRRCPVYAPTPLLSCPDLARRLGLAELRVKDERDRMGLGSFKALGAAYVIACDAEAGQARGRTYVTASAGNHGMSVAAGARAFGARAVVYIAETVPESFAQRLRDQGAEVVRLGATYEESMQAAASAAAAGGGQLLSDSSWPGYVTRPHRLMEGYLVLVAEAIDAMETPATHVFLQAGVGGLAGAAAALIRARWGDGPIITVVEPEEAPALAASIAAGHAVVAPGGVSAMGRLDCKEPSLIALKGLARDADAFMTISEAEGQAGADLAAEAGLPSTPSGAAGLAGLLAQVTAESAAEKIAGGDAPGPQSRVLLILSEGPEA